MHYVDCEKDKTVKIWEAIPYAKCLLRQEYVLLLNLSLNKKTSLTRLQHLTQFPEVLLEKMLQEQIRKKHVFVDITNQTDSDKRDFLQLSFSLTGKGKQRLQRLMEFLK